MMSKHKKHKRKHHTSEDYDKRKLDVTSNKKLDLYNKQDDPIRDETFWKKEKSLLNKLFFTDDDIIKKGTKEYDDFWDFLHKYYSYKKLKSEDKDANISVHNSSAFLNLPLNYKEEYRINFKLGKNIGLIYSQIPKDYDTDDYYLSENDIQEFSLVLQLYINFLQKQKFTKLCKLRKTQINLPIHQYKDALLNVVKNNQIVIVAGDTGCGKSTQIPQYLVHAGWTYIACTQPRRIACTSLCHRVAYETLNEYGSEIGYQIRFEKNKTKYTRILFLTEGLLLRQVAADPLLTSYNVIILDEVHERHLHSDFLMGIMKCLALQRPELKIILMSATINIQLFTQYFKNAPVIQVPGRLYPIVLNYFPISKEERKSRSGRIDPSPYIRILHLIDQKYPETERGDLLMFLSGISEISTVAEAAKIYAQQTHRWIILPLHSTLSVAEQDKVFDYPPEGVRKCIISTNIAETSITIDGIRFVVDSGKVKEMSYDLTCRMQRLQEFWISKASSEQRKGRAGRTGPGVCYRLYSETDYNSFDDYSLPEIQRVPLDSLILQMIAMGLPNARKFPFIEPPSLESIENSIVNLKEQEALDKDEQITIIGKLLSKLPVDISIGKMLIMGTLFGKIEPILLLAAGLSIQSPFTNQTQRDPEIMAARRNLESGHGDPFTLLNAYNKWLKVKTDNPHSSRKWCRKHGLEEQRFYEMTKLRHQFKQLLEDAGLIKMLSQKRALSSVERSQRHGEVKQLQQLKREARYSKKKRKILKLEIDDLQCYGTDDDEEAEATDIKAIDFQLSHDKYEIQSIAEVAQNLRNEDITLLKIVLCSGLYPSLALADEFNSYKTDADQLFHTKTKHFVVLHPLSGFSLQPEVLKITDADIIEVPGFEGRHPVSNRHQLLLFMSLLETTKPYLLNNTRVPALQTLLLFSSVIDTNEDFSRLIFDSWIEIKFPNPSDGQDLIMQILQLREQWMQLLQQKFDNFNGEKNKIENSSRRTDEIAFSKQLINFILSDVFYTIRRLLAADLHDLYVGYVPRSSNDVENSIFGINAVPHPKKGGLHIKDFLVYNCLQSTLYQDYLQNRWICPFCQESMFATTLEKMEHEMKCNEKNEMEQNNDENIEHQSNPNKKTYFCELCAKELCLTAPEILLHKKWHRTMNTNS